MNARRNSRGVALLLVLWLVALFTALVGGFARTAQMERLQGSVLRDSVIAGEAARIGLPALLVILGGWFAGVRFPFGVPAALVAVIVGIVIAALNFASPAPKLPVR